MNEVMQNILTRVSTRDFGEQQLTKQAVEPLIQAALYAPSGMCKQTWHFTAVLNQAIIAEFAAAIGKALGREGYCFYNAKALIIPSNQRENPFSKEDNACALQNIFLAAHSMGIDSVWINQASKISDEPEIRAILAKLGVPDDHIVFGIAALGYATTPFEGMKEKIGTFSIVE